MPAPRKVQERFIPEGNIENLRLVNARMAEAYDEDQHPTLGLESVVMDGEYAGTPVTDYLNIQESKKNSGELYISKKGKLGRVLLNALSVPEYNAMCEALAKVEETREEWLPIIAEAINDAENPVLRAVIVQNDPVDEINKRNKLSKKYDDINPYIDPEENEKVLSIREQIVNGSKQNAQPEISDQEVDVTIPNFGNSAETKKKKKK